MTAEAEVGAEQKERRSEDEDSRERPGKREHRRTVAISRAVGYVRGAMNALRRVEAGVPPEGGERKRLDRAGVASFGCAPLRMMSCASLRMMGCASLMMVGCASSKGPEAVALECERAFGAGQVEGAPLCFGGERFDSAELRALLRRDAAEHRAAVEELAAGNYAVEVRVRGRDGREYSLVKEDDGYRVDSVPWLEAGEPTIEAALHRLERSLAALGEDAFLALLVPERREELRAHLDVLRKGLREPSEARVVDLGERVVVELSGGFELRFRRVDGRYLLEEIE